MRRAERGAIAVETALTLPLILLLTLGGLSVLWWLHNKVWMQMVVYEVARERAGDATWTGYFKDVRDTVWGPSQAYGLPELSFLSFHLGTDPPLVLTAACRSLEGAVPLPPTWDASAVRLPSDVRGDGWDDIRTAREYIEQGLREVEAGLATVDGWADRAISTTERLIWYRRVAGNLAGKRAHQKRQGLVYIVGAVVEWGGQRYCGDTALTAKAVIQGEKTFAQR
jgi:hypothetical protein